MMPNYVRPSMPAQPKPEPRIVKKVAKRRAVQRMDRAEKDAVRQRDKEACRVCFRKSREVHERLMKSLGGVASAFNSCVLCRRCHQYAHAHGLRIFPTVARLGCAGPVTFAMCAAVAHDIFRGRAVPSHVEILPVAEPDPEGRPTGAGGP